MKKNDCTLQKTGDGTPTIYSPEYDENMHSQSGAYQEAVRKHIIPSGILEKNSKHLQVLDIGFGMGYNILALLKMFQLKAGETISIISLEKDRSYSSLLDSVSFGDKRDLLYSHIKNAFINKEYKDGSITIRVLIGDARKHLSDMSGYTFDAVFQDPFSPAKNPELWSVEYFTLLKKHMARHAVLTTYSSAPQIRMAMIEAGLFLGQGPSVGGKKEGTLASPENQWPGFHTQISKTLLTDIKATPYHDRMLKEERPVLLERRINEMKRKREIDH